MKFIFQTMPAYGHLNPMLGVAKELVKKGHRVIIYNFKDFKEKILNSGAEFREPPVKIMENLDFRILHNAIHIAKLSLRATDIMTDSLIKIIQKEKPDCLVHDSLSLWSKIAGLYTKTPSVSLTPSMAINMRTILGYTSLLMSDYTYLCKHPFDYVHIAFKFQQAYKKKGLIPPFMTDIFSNSEKLNIIFTSRAFQPFQNSFNNTFKFVGPIVYDRKENEPHTFVQIKKPLIYVALGTVYNDNQTIYHKITEALGNTKYQIYVSIGKYLKESDFKNIPKNIMVKQYLPQLEMLKNASLFISHAGMNSVNESLYFGVPLLMLPIIQEQKINASRVEELGAGIFYREKKVDAGKLHSYIDKLLTNPSYKSSTQYIGKTLHEAGGAKRAVSFILNFLKRE